MKNNIITLPIISCCPDIPSDFVKRDAFLNQIEIMLGKYDVIFVEGEEGVGKTTILLDFVYQKFSNTVSHFVNRNHKYSYSSASLTDNLYNQIYFFCNGEEYNDDIIPDLTSLNAIQGNLLRKIKKLKYEKGEYLYFVFGDLENIEEFEIELLCPIFEALPWGKAKFLFTGAQKHYLSILNKKELRKNNITIPNFGFIETKKYLEDICKNEEQIREIHRISDRGNPGILKEIKLLCDELGGVNNFLDKNDLTAKEDFCKKFWGKVDESNDLQIDILSVIAFSDIQFDKNMICGILNIDESALLDNIPKTKFLEITNTNIEYHSNIFKNYAKKRLSKYEDSVNNKLIDYFEKNIDEDFNSSLNLPRLYRKAKDWEKITKCYSIDAVMRYLQKYKTITNIKSVISDGYTASQESSESFNESRLRFALHKSSVMELERIELWESEIEARMALGDYDYAVTLANSAFLMENRLKLLAILAKNKKVKFNSTDKDLNEQIRSIYNGMCQVVLDIF